MKKLLIIFSAIAIIAAAVIFVTLSESKNTDSDSSTQPESAKDIITSSAETTTEKEATVEPIEKESYAIQETQALFTVDNWLKIYSVSEYKGKMALIAENISKDNIEFAVLTLKTDDSYLTFNISALFKGERAYLVCNEDYSSDMAGRITFRKTDNRILYAEEKIIDENTLSVTVKNGAFSIKNISETDISSDICIYYKEIVNNLPNGSVTHRLRINGLKAGALTYVKADGINTDNCRIIFTEYE